MTRRPFSYGVFAWFAFVALAVAPGTDASAARPAAADTVAGAAVASADTARNARPDTAAVVATDTLAADTTGAHRRGPGAVVDTTAATAALPALRAGAFDIVPKNIYLRRHSTSFDRYLEGEYRYFLARRGPVGKDAAVSRWGIGRGRALVLLDGIEFNDPQNGLAPLAHIPVAGLHELRMEHGEGPSLVYPHAIEGTIAIDEVPFPAGKAHTFIELSNGDRALRQRRVRFASKRAQAAIDIGYDEVLNNGYSFDAAQFTGVGNPDYGRSQTRHGTARVRGVLDEGVEYELGFRRYVADSQGDLASSLNDERRSGHLATIRATVGRFDLTLFERGFKVEDVDSNTVNSTRAAYTTFRAVRFRGHELTVKAGIEDIFSEQRVGGALGNGVVRRLTGSVDGSGSVGPLWLAANASVDGYWGRSTGWGFGADAGWDGGSNDAVLTVRRSYRMPALGEMFLPAHVRGGTTVAGNDNVGDEHAWELMGRLTSRRGALTNELRVGTIRVQDPITFLPGTVGGTTWLTAGNGPSATMAVVDEHLRVDAALAGIQVTLDGGVAWTGGDREGFFRSSPEVRTSIGGRVGRDLFKNTSALFLSADYAYTSERRDYAGTPLSSFGVLNVYLEGRLIDAHLYVAMLNVLDEQYETVDRYLMTPRTFVYGLSWTLFN